MNKCFYKWAPIKKTFFYSGVFMRSFAYGEKMKQELAEWLNYYETKKRRDRSIKLFRQEEFYRCRSDDYIERVGSISYNLAFNGLPFTVNEQKFLTIKNYEAARVGTLKAYGIMIFKDKMEFKIFTVVENSDRRGAQIVAFDVDGYDLKRAKTAPVDLKGTILPESRMLIVGNHILLIHNRVLYYYYYNRKRDVIEQVGVGKDSNPETVEFCKNVEPMIVADRSGRIYWQSGDGLYYFSIGTPKTVKKIEQTRGVIFNDLEVDGADRFIARGKLRSEHVEYIYRFDGRDFFRVDGLR